MKRTFDIVVSAVALLFLAPLLALIVFLIRIDSPGPVFFRQQRLGKRWREFTLYKFRTMRVAPSKHNDITFHNDPRITRVGVLLRKLKLDELPQLYNVLRGDMSFVGPRPQVPSQILSPWATTKGRHYPAMAEEYADEYRRIMAIRPGITDYASIKYRYESEELSKSDDPLDYYRRVIMPDKMLLQLEYLERKSMLLDLLLIALTLRVCVSSRKRLPVFRGATTVPEKAE